MLQDLISAIILGIVEGLTEFIPVSSTGHLIVVGHLLRFDAEWAASFEVFIQLGAILAVVILYWDRFWGLLDFKKSSGFSGWKGISLLGLTSLPALAIGLLVHPLIKQYLFSPLTVAIGLGVGGVAILLLERWLEKKPVVGLDGLTWKNALVVGLAQVLALWPGVSRSAATILGGMGSGLDRKTSAEYSFLAAVPVLLAAGVYDLYKTLPLMQGSDFVIFGVGFFFAFGSAWIAIKFFLRLVSSYSLAPFGWYRIGVALLILILL